MDQEFKLTSVEQMEADQDRFDLVIDYQDQSK